MRVAIADTTVLILAATLAWGQIAIQQSKTFSLKGGQSAQELEALAMTVRTIGALQTVSGDPANNSLTVTGTAQQIEIANWLLGELDRPATEPVPANSGEHQYRIQGDRGDIARIFYLGFAVSLQDQQQIMMLVRTMEDIRRAFCYSPRRALAMRGTEQQFHLATWLIDELARPAGAEAASPDSPRQYQIADGTELVRLFFLKPPQTPKQLQEKLNAVHAQANVSRIFYRTSPPVIAVRGTPAQIHLAEQAINALP